MALAVLVGDFDRFLELALAQRPGYGWSKLTRLLAGRIESEDAVDHDSDRPCRHDEEHANDALAHEGHIAPHSERIKTNGGRTVLQHERPYLNLKKHSLNLLRVELG